MPQSDTSATSPDRACSRLRAGQTVGGYVITRELGTGGMATVYAGEDVLGRPVAIKVLGAEWRESKEAVLRFLQEARVIAGLRHPHLIDLHAAGRLPGGRPYLVMNLVEGGSLRDLLALGLSVPDRFAIVRQVSGALAAAHRAGVVHRDVKPENILVERRAGRAPHARLADFGAAKLRETGEAWQPQTAQGRLVGTTRYMAPEQFCDGPIDHRADLYALGLVMYQVFTGTWPWSPGSDGHLVLCHTMYAPAANDRLSRRDPELSDLIMQCLEKDARKRPQSANEVATRLTSAGRSQAA